MPELGIIVPTRGRPANAARLIEGFQLTEAQSDLILVVDMDDPALDEYLSLGVICVAGVHTCMNDALNQAAIIMADRYRYLGFMGDDHLPRTLRWDARFIESLSAKQMSITYGDDLIQHENLPTAVFLDSRIVQTLGYMSPPKQKHLYLDNFWKDLGNQLGTLSYRGDVIIEHMHPLVGKAPNDEHYDRVNAGSMYEHDRLAYEAYVAEEMADAVAALRAEMF